MIKTEAIHSFFNSFGVPAYPSTRVPDDVVFPYLTYEPTMASKGNTTRPRVCLWFYGDSEVEINALAERIIDFLKDGHSIAVDGGNIVIHFTESWQGLTDQASEKISGRFTNLSIDFNTY